MIDTKRAAADDDFQRAMHFLDRACAQRDAAAEVGGKTGQTLSRLADKFSDNAVRLILKSDG